ncbi:MAG: DNA polymerase III subunit gamma/tau [Clostridia bacterium]|nr:DNA polymerase III subunit gamma/tau [Clostridia bacterium]
MEYQALYRKYRPATWQEVVGQKHITTALTNQIKHDTISHAYLFCGTRGTGKTSIARIFAKSINCEHPQNGSPCGKCDVCKALSDPNNLDIIEIDAASNNRVDEIRELREKVKYPPIHGKYKVYIIDEVHMLTDSAFNALLKTLEEPPTYVVFILGTTEVQKLPATILSRCLRFDFKLISQEELEGLLEKVFKDSGIAYEKEAVSLIARLGEGSARDTLSIADMCVAYTDRNVTYKAVVEAVGATDKKVLHTLASHLLAGDVTNLLQVVDDIAKSGKNLSQLAKDLAAYFRDVAVVKTCDNYVDILKLPMADIEELKALAKYDINMVLGVLKKLSGLEQEFRYTQNPRALLEVVLLNIVTSVNELKPNKPMALDAPNSSTITKSVNDVKRDYSGSKVFGKLLISLRDNKEYKTHAMLGSVTKTIISGNELDMFVNGEDNYKSISNDDNLNVINKYLSQIDNNLTAKPILNENKKSLNVEEMLRDQFGDMLTIR